MADENFMQIVEKIVKRDMRYRPDAYEFVSDAVSYTIHKLSRENLARGERHVSGEELIQGIADYAKNKFGPLAWHVLYDWGLISGASIGDVVFNMIEVGLLTASERDSRKDFNSINSLKSLLVEQGRPGRPKKAPPPPIIA